MQHRQHGATQEVAAAKAGISTRSGRRIEYTPDKPAAERHWCTREDSLETLWERELLVLLDRDPLSPD